MVGLRTQESDKFLVFFRMVQDEAAKRGKIFYLDTGEGHQWEDDTIDCENITGWLVDPERKAEFEKEYFTKGDDISEEWDEGYVLAVWEKKDGRIVITFE